MTDEGRPGCPTEQEKKFRWGDRREPLFSFYKERLGTGSPPSSDPASPAHLPRGEGFGRGCFPSDYNTPPPSPPSRGAGRYGRGIQGRRPGKKEGGPPAGSPPNQKRWVQGGRTSSSLVFFLRLSSKESRASRPEPAGKPRRRPHPAPVQKAPKRGPLPGRRPTGAAPRGFGKAPTTRRVRSTPPPPAGGAAPSHVSGPAPQNGGLRLEDGPEEILVRARISRSSR